MHQFEYGSQVLWILNRIPELQTILDQFDKTASHINDTIVILISDGQKGAEKKAAERHKELLKRLDKLDAQRHAFAEARKQDDKFTAVLTKVLKEMSQKDAKDAASGKGDGKKRVEGLVDVLVKEGMKPKDAKTKIEATMKVLRSEQKTQKATIKRSATDEAKKGVGGKGKSAASTKEPGATSNNVWILCVDQTNGREFFRPILLPST